MGSVIFNRKKDEIMYPTQVPFLVYSKAFKNHYMVAYDDSTSHISEKYFMVRLENGYYQHQTGCSIKDLIDGLQKQGFDLEIYPQFEVAYGEGK